MVYDRGILDQEKCCQIISLALNFFRNPILENVPRFFSPKNNNSLFTIKKKVIIEYLPILALTVSIPVKYRLVSQVVSKAKYRFFKVPLLFAYPYMYAYQLPSG
uniref:Uncharacterized protein n=1 Tax=Cacopsylla melanoneura TaxID=428564 RepID=A0A8D9A840_9HEMI